MEFRELTADDRASFLRDGFLVVRNALATDEVEDLIAAGDKAFASEHADLEYGSDGKRTIRNCLPLGRSFYRLLAHSSVVPFVVQLLGPNIHLLSSQLLYVDSLPLEHPRTIRIPARHGWHQDLYGSVADLGTKSVPRLAVKCAYYLTDVTGEFDGMTMFVPGSHRSGVDVAVPTGQIDPPGAVRLSVEAGDAVLFENRIWHSGGINACGTTRKCIMMQYGYRWMLAVDDAKSGPVNGFDYSSFAPESATAIERQLLDAQIVDEHEQRGRGIGAAALQQWCDEHGFMYQPAP